MSAYLLLSCLLIVQVSFVLSFQAALRSSHVRSSFNRLNMALIENFDALLFDCDGVIAETERDAHRVTFNQAFKDRNIDADWTVELYGELLKVGGGKERMTSYFDKVGWPSSIPEDQRQDVIKELHKAKTAKFQSAVASGIVPARPGGSYICLLRLHKAISRYKLLCQLTTD